MKKLIDSGFRRLWKSPMLWIGIALMCGMSLLGVLNNFYYKTAWAEQAEWITADHTLLPDTSLCVIIVAVLIGLLIGREYSDKTVRNKLIAGHSRLEVYLAYLAVCVTAVLILYVVPMLAVGLAVGAPLLGGFSLSVRAFVLPLLCEVLALVAFASLFLLLVMAIASRPVGAIAVLLSALALMVIPTMLNDRLEVLEYVEDYVYVEELDDFVSTGEMVQNPNYLSGAPRVICQFLYDFLPGGALHRASPFAESNTMSALPLYSLLFIAASTAGGLFVFRRKDIK